MTTLRKWRFPILIGSGLIAAAALVYFSGAHIGADKTQGAIGKRDVYRDSQVASADVATPGSAPVATEAILESSEFKALAKDPAFRQMLASTDFNALPKDQLASLLTDGTFRDMASQQGFADLVSTELFHNEISKALKDGLDRNNIIESLHGREDFARFTNSRSFKMLVKNESFDRLALNGHFDNLLRMQSFINMMGNRQFAILASQADFKNQLESGMIWHSMESQLKNGALERSNLGTARNSLALGSSSVAGDEKAGR